MQTREILEIVKSNGVIVGSWPLLGNDAKDLDIVIKPTHERNPIFREIVSLCRENCTSVAPGHLMVWADPINVEIFEDRCWPIDGKETLSFNQAKRRSTPIDAFGIEMRAVV